MKCGETEYTAGYKCQNCGKVGLVCIEKGKLVKDQKCPRCGCEMLEPREYERKKAPLIR